MVVHVSATAATLCACSHQASPVTPEVKAALHAGVRTPLCILMHAPQSGLHDLGFELPCSLLCARRSAGRCTRPLQCAMHLPLPLPVSACRVSTKCVPRTFLLVSTSRVLKQANP